MKIGVFGTGMVGKAIAGKLVVLGHDVKMGAREAKNEKAAAWTQAAGAKATHGTFAEAAAFGEMVFNCTNGAGTIDALGAAGAANLQGKVLVDIANPLDVSKGMPPTLFVCNDDSLGERVQKAFPDTKVVKTLNTINCEIMVNPSLVPGDHDVFMSGNDPDAKKAVGTILTEGFGWKHVIDLGDISTSRATEMYMPMWIRMWGALKTANFNIHVVRG